MIAIEKGERRVRAGELLQLAQVYGQSVNDLLRDRPQLLPFAPQFRSQRIQWPEASTVFDASIREFETLCQDYLELEQLVNAPVARYEPAEVQLGRTDANALAESVAQHERSRLNLGDAPIALLRILLENGIGLRIFYMELKPSGSLAGLYAYSPELGGCIAVNRQHPEERRRWTMVHEYGHFLADRQRADALPDHGSRRAEEERFADAFARNFLLPKNGVVRRFQQLRATDKQFTFADLLVLAHDYGVSVEAMALRLEEVRLLQPGTADKIKAGNHKILPPVVERVLPHGGLILDACCAINLFATPYAGNILAAIRQPVAIAQFVVEKELLHLAALLSPDADDLAERLEQCGVVTVPLQEEEEALFLALAAQLDDGEAMSAAIAIARNWTIAADDRRVVTVLGRVGAMVGMVTTPKLIKLWAEQSAIDGFILRSVLTDIKSKARFRPWRSHPLYTWWHSSVG